MDFTITATCVGYDAEAGQYACIRPIGNAEHDVSAIDLEASKAHLELTDGRSIPATISEPEEFLDVIWWPVTWQPVGPSADDAAVSSDAAARSGSAAVTRGRLVINLATRDGSQSTLESLPLSFSSDALYNATFPAIAVDNATERLAPSEMGGGLYDCDSTMGEGYSHGIFLAGFAWMLLQRGHQIAPDVQRLMVEHMKVFVDYILKLRQESGSFTQQVASRPHQVDRGLMDTTEPSYGLFCAAQALSSPDVFARDSQTAATCREAALAGVQWLRARIPESNDAAGERSRLDIAALAMHAFLATGDKEMLDTASGLVDRFLGSRERTFPVTRWGAIPRVELFLRLLESPVPKSLHRSLDSYLRGELIQHLTSRTGSTVFPIPLPVEIIMEGPEHTHRVSNSHVASSATEALLLHRYTGDASLRRVADGYLQWIAGLNYGFPAGMTRRRVNGGFGAPEPAEGLCASMIVNTGERQVVPWDGHTPMLKQRATPVWGSPTIVNGLGAHLQYENIWQHGETFIKHDGFWLIALSLWNPDPGGAVPWSVHS
jgi:hypothetical protein